jgi:hypothetical protein
VAPLPAVKLDNCIGVVSSRKHRDLSVGGRAVSEHELTQLLLEEPTSASDEYRSRQLAALAYASLALSVAAPTAGFFTGAVDNHVGLGIGLGIGGFVLAGATAVTLLVASARDESRAMNAYNEHARASRSCVETFERTLKSLE